MDIRITVGKMLITTGIVIMIIGFLVLFSNRIPIIGHLPGDFTLHGKNWTLYFPLASAIILSIILSLVFNIFFRR